MNEVPRADTARVLYAIRNLLLILVLAALLACVYLYFFHSTAFLNAIERALVPDGKIDNRQRAVLMIFSALLLTIVILMAGIRRSVLVQTLAAWKAGDTVTLYRGVGYVSLVLVVIHLIDKLPWVNFKIYLAEDGVFEMATALFAFLAGLILLYVSCRQAGWRARLVALALGIGFLLFGMEEISWGQRLIGWETPGWLDRINDQGETTLHNLASHSVLNLVQALVAVFCALTLLALSRYSRQWIRKFDLNDIAHLLPDSGLSMVAWVLVFCVPYTLINGGELSEEILATLGLAYAVNQLMLLRSPLHLTDSRVSA